MAPARPAGATGARARRWLAILLILLGLPALVWAGVYLWRTQVPAPMPSAPFDVRTSTPATGSTATGPQAAVETAPPLAPNTLAIPSLSVQARMDLLGITDGELDLPAPDELTLYDGGALPGSSEGTVLVAGHVNSWTLGPGALFDLGTIRQHAAVWVTDAQGRAHEYQVVRLYSQSKTALPQDIFTATGSPRLVLVTCGGRVSVTPRGRSYESNVIVEALPTGRSTG